MRKIFKYKITPLGRDDLKMPKGAEILHVAMQYGQPCLWALVDDALELEVRTIVSCGTGHPAPPDHEGYKYLGTVLLHADTLVFHFFEDLKL